MYHIIHIMWYRGEYMGCENLAGMKFAHLLVLKRDEMKKILFIINSLGGGGAEKALIEFLRHIDYTRYEVSLCLVFHEGCYLSDVPPEVRVFWLYERERNFVHRKSLKIARLLTRYHHFSNNSIKVYYSIG